MGSDSKGSSGNHRPRSGAVKAPGRTPVAADLAALARVEPIAEARAHRTPGELTQVAPDGAPRGAQQARYRSARKRLMLRDSAGRCGHSGMRAALSWLRAGGLVLLQPR